MDRGEIERRPLNRAGLAFDLVNHLRVNLALGRAAVICERPAELMGEAHRQILKTTRRLQAERAEIEDVTRLIEVSSSITRLQCLRLSAEPDDYADVAFATPKDFAASPPIVEVLYVTCEIENEALNRLTALTKPGDLIVLYG